MKKAKSLLACAVLLALSACGGGGSGGGNGPSVSTPPKPGVTKPDVSKPGATKPGTAKPDATKPGTTKPGNQGQSAGGSGQGGALMATGKLDDVANAKAAALSGDKDSKISVNGHEIQVAYPYIQSKGFSVFRQGKNGNTVHTITSGHKFSHMRFGYQYLEQESKYYVFAVGNVTPADAVPAKGKAVYAGDATFNGFTEGNSSSFEVDFGGKTIKGKAVANQLTVPLEGTIKGSSFSGTKNNVTMQGNFFGPKAEELSGVFKGKISGNNGNPTSVIGSFGAVKQQ